MLYFIVSNEMESMFFSFSRYDFKIDYDVFGILLDKDFDSKNPKASFVLLTQEILTEERKEIFKTKINPTNIIIVDNTKSGQEESFKKNLKKHIDNLSAELDRYKTKEVFTNFFKEEFKFFYNEIFRGFKEEDKFYINSLVRNVILILDFLKKNNAKVTLKIFYTIEYLEKSLFSQNDYRLYDKLIEFAQTKKFKFEFILCLEKNIIINKELKDKFKLFEDLGIDILFYEYDKLKIYSNILIIDDYNLAISSKTGYIAHYLTKKQPNVEKLHIEYKLYKKDAKSLKNFNTNIYPLVGTWFLYGYGAQNILHEASLEFHGLDINITLHTLKNKTYKGNIRTCYNRILISSELGFIDFDYNNKEKIKIVSMMTTEDNGLGRHTILFAIFSQKKLKIEDVKILLSHIIDKSHEINSLEKGILKVSHNINQYISELLCKYDDN